MNNLEKLKQENSILKQELENSLEEVEALKQENLALKAEKIQLLKRIDSLKGCIKLMAETANVMSSFTKEEDKND